MHFEHLVEVNDPLIPLLPLLSREQLWRGLVRRAEQPCEFVLGLDGATLHARSAVARGEALTRTLDFGSFQVHDRVLLLPPDETRIETRASPRFPASTLTIRIEEPQPQRLYLRFVYESAAVDGAGELDATTVALRNQAYEQADIDTVGRIRELAEAGLLG